MLQVGQNAYNWHTKNVVQFKNFWQYHIKNNDNNNNNNYKFTRFNIITEKLKLGIASTTDIEEPSSYQHRWKIVASLLATGKQ